MGMHTARGVQQAGDQKSLHDALLVADDGLPRQAAQAAEPTSSTSLPHIGYAQTLTLSRRMERSGRTPGRNLVVLSEPRGSRVFRWRPPMRLAIAAALLTASMGAQASCFGSGSFQTCTDSSGNNYNVQRYGNTTNVQGYNPSAGSNWNQSSQTYGNTTFHNGTAANGISWNGTTQTYGNTQFSNGTDSRGNSYNRTCQRIGNQTFCN
ncbi:hypothetical protein [Caenimonas sedimenti]|nr:hypothetical protein [Caenimonas sedimenti]